MGKKFNYEIDDIFNSPEPPAPKEVPDVPKSNTSEKPSFTYEIEDLGFEEFKTDPLDAFTSTVIHYDSKSARHNFERYYSHDLFQELGFSPLVDNESLYNAKSTSWQEYSRAAKQLPGLFGLGVMDAATSWFGGRVDTEAAREMEYRMAVGSSAKGGMDSWGTGFTLSLGYSMGIIAELAVETVALNYITGGGASEFSAVRIGAGASKLDKAFNFGKNMFGAIKQLGNLKQSRAFYEGVKKSKGLAKVGNFLNPLEGSTAVLKAYKNGALGGKAAALRGAGAFYLDIKHLEIAASEAQLEAGTIQNTLLDEMYSEYYHENGEIPSEQESKRMAEIATDRANQGFNNNMSILYMSNKIMFDTLFSSFKIAKNGTQKVMSRAGGKKLLYDTRKKAAKKFSVENDNFFSNLRNIHKNPKLALRAVKDYSLINSSEGIQEVLQEGITGQAEEDGMNQFRGNSLEGYFISDYLSKSAESLTRSEGWAVFASGFLTGIPMQAIQNSVTGGAGMIYDNFNKKGKENKAKEIASLNEREGILNKMSDEMDKKDGNLRQRITTMGIIHANTMDMKKAVLDEDKKAYENSKSSTFNEYLRDVIDRGGEQMLLDNLDSLTELTEEEIKESFGLEKDDFLGKIDFIKGETSYIKELIEYRNEKIHNPYNPNKYEKDDPKRKDEILRQKFFEKIRNRFVTKNYEFKNVLGRINAIHDELVNEVGFGSVLTADIDVILSSDNATTKTLSLKNELKIYSESTEAEDIKKVESIKKKIKVLEEYAKDTFALSSETTAKKGGKKLLESRKQNYLDYLELLAKEQGVTFDPVKAESSYQKVVDYGELKEESKQLQDDVKMILDPGFIESMEKHSLELGKDIERIRNSKDARDLIAYKKNVDIDPLVKRILDKYNVFLSPENLDLLMNENKMPSRFIETGVGENGSEFTKAVEIESKKYRDIVNEIRSDFEARGIELGNDYELPAGYEVRAQKTKTTYSELAEKYFFNSDGSNSDVDAKVLLEAIINDSDAKKADKDLARNLLSIVGDMKVLITQDKGLPSGVTNTGDAYVDARFSSSDYELGKKIPFEISLLRSIIDSVMMEELENNSKFSSDIKAIYKKAKGLSKDSGRYEYVNINMFISQLLTNREFQKELSEMEGTDTESLWTDFLSTLRNLMSKLFKNKINNNPSLLNDAINIIATNLNPSIVIDNNLKGVEEKDNTKRTKENTKLGTYNTSEEIVNNFTEDIHKVLVDLYKDITGYKNEDEKSNIEIIKSDGFIKFWNNNNNKKDIKVKLDIYNDINNRIFYQDFKAFSNVKLGSVLEERLEELGYKVSDYEGKIKEAEKIANLGMTKADAEDIVNKTREEEREIMNKASRILKEKVRSISRDAKTGLDLESAGSKIDNLLKEKVKGFDFDGYTLFSNTDYNYTNDISQDGGLREAELFGEAKDIKLKKGMVFKSEKSYIVIDKITKENVTYHYLGNASELKSSTKDFLKKEKYFYSKDVNTGSIELTKKQSKALAQEIENIEIKAEKNQGKDDELGECK